MVGSFTEQKNHHFMLTVLQALPKHYKLVMCGEGILQEEIKKSAANLSLNQRTYFMGFREDISRIMHSVDVLVIPSKWEGFGLIAVEGMACDIPVVVSDVPGLAEVVGDAGIKVPCDDCNAFVSAIMHLANSDVYKSYVSNGQRQCLEYTAEKMAASYIKCFNKLL